MMRLLLASLFSLILSAGVAAPIALGQASPEPRPDGDLLLADDFDDAATSALASYGDEWMTWVVDDGVGTLYGAVIGAAAFKVLYDLLAAATPQYWQFWLGLILVLLVLFVRGGIMGLLTSVYARLTGKGGAA